MNINKEHKTILNITYYISIALAITAAASLVIASNNLLGSTVVPTFGFSNYETMLSMFGINTYEKALFTTIAILCVGIGYISSKIYIYYHNKRKLKPKSLN